MTARGVGHVLGISAFYHDAAAALVSGGEAVAMAAEERFTRRKHDPNFPHHAVAFCLAQGGLTPRELDAVVFYEEPHVKFSRVLASTLAEFPRSRRQFVGAMGQWLGKKLWIRDLVAGSLDVPPDRVHFVPHHVSHAAQAFLASPFDEAAVLTLDAVGEWDCTSLARGDRATPDPVRTLESIAYPHSLGLVYSAFTAFLGFRPSDAECSTMALAAFGRPTYADAVRRLVRLDRDGTYSVDGRYFDFLGGEPFRPPFIELFGAPRRAGDPLPFDSLRYAPPAPSGDDQRWADVAASVQLVVEEAVLGLARRAQRLTGSRRLCLAGGVALNAVANGRLVAEGPFDEIFVPPDPGDGGGALGAALYHASRVAGVSRARAATPYLGRGFDPEPDFRMLDEVDHAGWASSARPGVARDAAAGLTWRQYEDLDELVEDVAGELEAGRIVGWVQGRFEVGPRALGNRSILVDPGNLPTVRRLSRTVKSRAAFRPYALSVAEEDAGRVFDFGARVPHTARWMQMVAPVRRECASAVRGALHADGSTRPQVCSAEENPRYHRLLTAFGRRRGLAALLNTSFNDSGHPLVQDAAEALLVFARTGMDALVFDSCVVRRPTA